MTRARIILWGIVGLPVVLFLTGIIIALPFWLIAQGVSLITTGTELVAPDIYALVPEHAQRGLFHIWLGFVVTATIVTLPVFIDGLLD